MVEHTFNSSMQGAEGEDLSEFEAHLVYIATVKCMPSTRQRQADLFQS